MKAIAKINKPEEKIMVGSSNKPHVLVLPFPSQSHINQMLEFSKHIASNNHLKVTFIITSKITKFAPNIPSHLNIASISDGSEQIQEPETTETMFNRFKSVVSKNLCEFIDQKKQSLCPAKVIVYDSIFPWILDIAHEQDLVGASFFTQSCAASAIYYHIKKGLLVFPYDQDLLTVSLPSMPTLEINDLPAFKEVMDSNQTIVRLLVDQFSNLERVDWVLFNTFDKLENEVVDWIASQWPIKTIGPTNLLQEENKNHSVEQKYTISMFESGHGSCTEWLDARETGSVVYVSLGSVVSVKPQQMEELAQGLMMSKCYFLWVLRAEEMHKLLTNFPSLASEKGLIVNWCCQTEVLTHRALSCFLTHGGWNSTLEALSYGVPVIAMPHWVDQTTNSKFIEDVWRVGIRVKAGEDGIVSREEIAKCVNEVSEGEKGKDVRRNAGKWKTLARDAVSDGGTSGNNIKDFVSTIFFMS